MEQSRLLQLAEGLYRRRLLGFNPVKGFFPGGEHPNVYPITLYKALL